MCNAYDGPVEWPKWLLWADEIMLGQSVEARKRMPVAVTGWTLDIHGLCFPAQICNMQRAAYRIAK